MIEENLQIRDDIDELVHQMEFLQKSQIEIKNFLQTNPEDDDFIVAFEENKTSLNKRYEKLLKLNKKLQNIDPTYRSNGKNLIENIDAMRASLTTQLNNIEVTKTTNSNSPNSLKTSSADLYL
jgi:hypothetical protein